MNKNLNYRSALGDDILRSTYDVCKWASPALGLNGINDL
jgi:hypothetical protein